MTAPAVDFELSLAEQCSAIWEATEQREREMRRERAKPARVLLRDGDMNLRHVVRCENEALFPDVDNDTGTATISIDYDRPEAQWIDDMHGRIKAGEKLNVHIQVDHCGMRWTGRLDEADVVTDETGHSVLSATFLSDYEELKWFQLWSNPVFPAAFQMPRVFMLAGPAIWVLKTALFLNLLRAHGNLWTLPDDPLGESTIGLDQSTWPVVIKPTSFVEDLANGTTWALLASRWKTWHDVAQLILEDAELSVQWRRWFEGDPEPWPGANLRNGALVIDIVDKSGIFEGTANGGTLFDGLTRAVRTFTNDFVENEDSVISGRPTVDDYRRPGYLHTDARVPYVYYGPKSPGVKMSSFKSHPAKCIQINTGGHSMSGVNEALDAMIQFVGDVVGNALQIGSIGGSAATLIMPFLEDTILAWISVKLFQRAQMLGDFRYFEYFIESAGKAYTLSSLMVIRAGAWATRTWFSAAVEIQDGAPYLVGGVGKGHFGKGDRIAVAKPGDLTRRLHVDRVRNVTMSWSRGKQVHYSLAVGNDDAQEDPVVRLMARIERIRSALQDLGVF